MIKRSRKICFATISGGIIGKPGILSRSAGKKKDQELGLSWSLGLIRVNSPYSGALTSGALKITKTRLTRMPRIAAKTIAGIPLGNR